MLKKIIIIIVTGILIILLSLWGLGEYFFNILFKKDDNLSKQIAEVNQQENIQYRNVDFLKAQKWWDSMNVEELNIVSYDGLNLTGYLLKTNEISDKLVILAHGRLGDSKTMVLFAQYYYQNGYNVFVTDERACGISQGEILGMGYLDSQDYELWINKIIEKLEDPDIKIILHGVSTGATAFTLLCDKELPNIKCIIADSGYSSLKEFINYRLKTREQFTRISDIKCSKYNLCSQTRIFV